MKLHLKHKIKNLSYKTISNFKDLDPSNALSLFCDPRGGSTWIAETLNTITNSTIIDEPLHLKNMKSLQKMDFSWRQYIPEDAKWPEAKLFFNQVLKGKKLNAGTCYRNTPLEVIQAQQIILKIIRGKALLPWYVKQFTFKYKPLFVIRNPFAVAASQLNHRAWNYDFQPFQIPSSPFREFYDPHESFLKSLKSKEEQQTARWCMTNNTVLNHSQNNHSWISINYEDLILKPNESFKHIFNIWNLEIPETLFSTIHKPSTTTVGKTQIKPEQLLKGWQKKLSSTQIDQLQKVLDYFEVTYYSKEILPVIPAHKVHL